LEKRVIFQFYGYIVVIIAIIVFLVSISNLISAIFDLSDPLHAEYDYELSLVSFENYRIDVLRGLRDDIPIPEEETIWLMYGNAKDHKIKTVRFRSRRSIAVNGMLIIISFILFTSHLIWMRRLPKVE
jgi:hypothetical protein